MIIISTEVKKFINQLESPADSKCWRMVGLLERFQYSLGMPHSKAIGSNIFELRVRGKQEIRLIYTFQKGNIILFHGFVKKSQAIPQSELHRIHQKLQQLQT